MDSTQPDSVAPSADESPNTDRNFDSPGGTEEVLRGSTSSPDIHFTKSNKKAEIPREIKDF